MAVQVYGSNHVVIEVDDAQKAMEFYADVFKLEMLRGGEGHLDGPQAQAHALTRSDDQCSS